jgi:hypothetical protein
MTEDDNRLFVALDRFGRKLYGADFIRFWRASDQNRFTTLRNELAEIRRVFDARGGSSEYLDRVALATLGNARVRVRIVNREAVSIDVLKKTIAVRANFPATWTTVYTVPPRVFGQNGMRLVQTVAEKALQLCRQQRAIIRQASQASREDEMVGWVINNMDHVSLPSSSEDKMSTDSSMLRLCLTCNKLKAY